MRITGHGGGGSGGSSGASRTAVEDPDSLQSRQYAHVVDLISEGLVEGLVNGLRSVYLDGTPIQAKNGAANFNGVTLDFRHGFNVQDHLPSPVGVENEYSVGVQVTNPIPIVRSISGNVDAARITIGVPALTSQDLRTGDLHGSSVAISISVQNNGGGYANVPLGYAWEDVPAYTLDYPPYPDSSITYGTCTQMGVTFTARFPSRVVYSVSGTYEVEAVFTTEYLPLRWVVEYRGPDDIWHSYESGYQAGSAEEFSRTVYPPAGQWGSRSIRVTLLEAGSAITSCTGHAMNLSYSSTITGKTTSRYRRSYRVELPAPGPWDIKITRLTADSTSSSVQDETWWDSLAEIVDSKMSCPNSAMVSLLIDAKQFPTVPVRGYEIYGIHCQIPSNYDAVAHTYSGVWDGTFLTRWTDNPAWVFYDLLTNERYGIGAHVDVSAIDKWQLYEIGKYCDELVPSGFGYFERRYSCNLYLQTREDAYKVLMNMASVFRGMAFWSGGQVTATADMPSDPVCLFSNANVIDGEFTYSGSSKTARHTVALVTWNDPTDLYRQKVEYVQDEEGIAQFGVNETEVLAFGCTSRGQAHRMGKWILYTERMETDLVTFKTGLEGYAAYPGASIKIADKLRSGERIGGRFISVVGTTATIDAPVTLSTLIPHTLTAVLPDGTVEDRQITNSGTITILNLASAFSQTPQPMAMWTISSTDVVPQTFRVISVTEEKGTQATITALAYEPAKYAAIEFGVSFTPSPISTITTLIRTPTNLSATDTLYLQGPGLVGTKLHLAWQGNAPEYEVKWRQGSTNFKTVRVPTNSADIFPVNEGVTAIEVRALYSVGRKSSPASLTYTVIGKTAPPSNVANFYIKGVDLFWTPVSDLDVAGYKIRFLYGTSRNWGTATPLHEGLVVGSSYTMTTKPYGVVSLLIKAVDTTGNESKNVAVIVTNLGDPIVDNVLFSYDVHADGFPGALTGCAVEGGSGDLVSDIDSSPLMWADDSYNFWDLEETNPTWDVSTYFATSYEFSCEMVEGWVGAKVSLSTTHTSSAIGISYRKNGLSDMWSTEGDPMWDSDSDVMWTLDDWLPWPGYITAEVGMYEWKLDTPASSDEHRMSALSVIIDVPDIIESFEDLSVIFGGTRLPITKTYRQIKNVSVTLQYEGGGTAVSAVVMDKNASLGPLINCIDSSLNSVAGSIDATIQGF